MPATRSKKILVTGTGRCGTGYATKLLQAGGYDIGHEKMKRDGISSWKHAVPWILCDHQRWTYETVIHLVREPLGCIGSLHSITSAAWKRMSQASPIKDSMPRTLKGMIHWHVWNLLCEQLDPRFDPLPIADLTPNILACEFDLTGKECESRMPGEGYPGWERISKTENTRKHPQLVWADLEKEDAQLALIIRRQAERYHLL